MMNKETLKIEMMGAERGGRRASDADKSLPCSGRNRHTPSAGINKRETREQRLTGGISTAIVTATGPLLTRASIIAASPVV
jgi:hypothetical protein